MSSLTDIQIGSIVLGMVENVPVSLSGAVLWNMVDNEVYYAERFIGTSIGTTAIAETYQPAIISLTAAAIVRMMEMQGADVSNLRLGDFSVSKGSSSSTAITSEKLREDGLRKLENLGMEVNMYKSNG